MTVDVKGIAVSAVDTAFGLFSGQIELVAVKTFGANPDWSITDSDAVQDSTTFLDVELIPLTYKESQIDGTVVRVGDEKGLLRVADILVPLRLNDEVTRADDSLWVVKFLKKDPSDTLYIATLRRANQ